MARARSEEYEKTAHRRAFGARVRELRLSLGLSQYQFAEKCGVARTYLAEIETGARNPTLDKIYQIAAGLEVPVTDLFV
jgi:transcriptional regulator with XRE-family HTH domain